MTEARMPHRGARPPPEERPGRRGGRRTSKPRADLPTFLLHWGLVVGIAVSLSTGLRVGADFTGSLAGGLASSWAAILPRGRVLDWHMLSSWAVTGIAATYALFLWRSRLFRRVRFSLPELQKMRGAGERAGSDRPGWFAFHRFLFQVVFGLILTLAVTGWWLYSGSGARPGPYWIAAAHGLAAWGVVAFVGVHVFSAAKTGTLGKMFRPRRDHSRAFATSLVLSGTAIALGFSLDARTYPTLRVEPVDDPPRLDGRGDDAAWGGARAVEIQTSRGANLPDGESRVTVRSVHDGEYVYFLFRWADPQRSQKMLPLVKTDSGWVVLESGYDRHDENAFYEDKFAAILSTEPAIGSGTAHLGENVIPGPFADNRRGLHFTEDGSIVDLWHWKSVRTGGMRPGHADDSYIGPPLPPAAPGARYTGGYTQDPSDGPEPYEVNWTRSPGTGGVVRPKYLPRDPGALLDPGSADLDPGSDDPGVWSLSTGDVVPYSEDRDDLPIGAVLPGIVVRGPLTGDRGDLRAEGRWEAGHWTLELRRLLDTGSPYDVALTAASPTYLWVAVFDHTQTRHSHHLRPARLLLEPD